MIPGIDLEEIQTLRNMCESATTENRVYVAMTLAIRWRELLDAAEETLFLRKENKRLKGLKDADT